MRLRPRPGPGSAGSLSSSGRPRHRIARAAANILLPIVITLLGTEALGQFWFGNPHNYSSYRFTYLSADPFVGLDNGSWTYAPNTTVTETVVYKRPFSGYFAESTCAYPIDEMGFVDNPAGRRDYDLLLLGDSFTAGEVGCSWIGELRRVVPQLAVYNAGLPATGIENWTLSEQHLLGHGFRFAHVVLIFIADDFFRPQATRGGQDIACLHDMAQCTPHNYAYPLIPDADLAATSARRARTGLRDEVDYWWARNLWVSHFLIESVARRMGAPPTITPATVAALDAIRAAGGAIHLIKVPTKTEAALRADSRRSQLVDRLLASRRLTYDRCPIPYDEFFSYDAHPTARGYARLAACVGRIVAALPPADSNAAATGMR